MHTQFKRAYEVEVTRAGSHFKARRRGFAACVFGATREEALARLRSTHSKRWGFVPAPITPIEQQLMKGLR
jgi:hypothetical protein